jgi:hypothetical protein
MGAPDLRSASWGRSREIIDRSNETPYSLFSFKILSDSS